MTQRDDDVEEVPDRASKFSLVVAATAGLSAIVLVLALLAIEQIQVTHEVLLWAPEHVRLGDPIPMRALVFTDLHGDAGGTLVQPEVRVRLVDQLGVQAEGMLRPSVFESVAGTLECAACTGELSLEAELREGEVLLARTTRSVRFMPEVPPLPEGARITDALQLLRIESDARVDALLPELDARAVGAVCVAESPCEVMLRGVPNDVQLTECENVELRAQRMEGAIRLLDLVIHGPEAHCVVQTEVEFPGAGLPVSEVDPATLRPSLSFGLQLPVALATARLDVASEGQTLVLSAEPPIGRTDVIVDIYREERWLETRALHQGEVARIEVAEPGITRLQARADVMSSERAYLRVLDTSHASSTERRWEFAQQEAQLIGVGQPATGFASDEAALASRRRWMRIVTALGVLSAFILMLASVVRQGIASEAEARSVLLASGVEDADSQQARNRSRWTVLAYVSGIALAVLMGTAFLLARPFWPG